MGIDFSSQRPNIDLPCLPTHWIVNDTVKDNETKTRRPAGKNSCLKKSRKYQLRRRFVGDQRSRKICRMEEAPPGSGTLGRRRGHARGSPTCWRVLESSPPHSALRTPAVVWGYPGNRETAESYRHQRSFGASSWDLWWNVPEPFRLPKTYLTALTS